VLFRALQTVRAALRAVILLGVVYLVVGITFGTLAGSSVSNQVRVRWRLAAWFASAVAFAAHIGYEHFRLRNAPRTTATHSSLAVALGAFGLALAANVHAYVVGSGTRPLLALVAWPALCGVPAFIAALAVAAILGTARRTN
jgi:hypothetical protein